MGYYIEKKNAAYIPPSKDVIAPVFNARSSCRWFRLVLSTLFILNQDIVHIKYNRLGSPFDACVLPFSSELLLLPLYAIVKSLFPSSFIVQLKLFVVLLANI